MTIKVFVCDADAWIDECGSYCLDGLSFGEFDEKCFYSNVFLFDFLTNLFIDQDTEISRHKLFKYLVHLICYFTFLRETLIFLGGMLRVYKTHYANWIYFGMWLEYCIIYLDS